MTEIEMLDIENNTTPANYLTKILEFSKTSTSSNSIVFDFEVDVNYCHCKAIKYDIDGSKQEIKEETFDQMNEVLKDLIEPFINHFAEENKIIINNVTPYKEQTSSLKMISEANDMCNIHGIDEDNATRLSEMVKKASPTISITQGQIDEKGVGNIVSFIRSRIILGTVIIGLLIPNFMK